jgi:hypothetical protein
MTEFRSCIKLFRNEIKHRLSSRTFGKRYVRVICLSRYQFPGLPIE